jgi:hypothetical protein
MSDKNKPTEVLCYIIPCIIIGCIIIGDSNHPAWAAGGVFIVGLCSLCAGHALGEDDE